MAQPPRNDPATDEPRRASHTWRWLTLPRVLTAFAGAVVALVVLATITSLIGPFDRARPGTLDPASAADGAAAPPLQAPVPVR